MRSVSRHWQHTRYFNRWALIMNKTTQQAHGTCKRVHLVRFLLLRFLGPQVTSIVRVLDGWNRMGGPCIVSFLLDCSQTFPWTATKTNRISHRRLFNGANRISHVLLCRVSIQCDYLFFRWSSLHARFVVVDVFTLGCILSESLAVRRPATNICTSRLPFI